MTRMFLLIFICINSLHGYAQNKNIDSLKQVLTTHKEDSNKVNTLLDISKYYSTNMDTTNALNNASIALEISQKISFKKGEAIAYFNIGNINFSFLSKMEEAIKNYSLALDIFKQLKLKEHVARCYEKIGTVFQYTSNWPEAVKNTYEAVKLYEETGNRKEVANAYFWIGFIYFWNNNYEKALTAFTVALKKFDEIDHDGHTGGCYIYIANIFLLQRRYSEALSYDSIGLKMAVSKNDRQMAANAYFSIGDIIAAQVKQENLAEKSVTEINQLNKASELYQEALKNFKLVGDPGGTGDSFGRLSEINIRLKRFMAAQKYADSALSIAKIIGFKDNLKYSYLVQSRLDSATGNFRRALETYKMHIIYRDSIANEENTKRSTEIQMQYDFDKKEAIRNAELGKREAETRRTRQVQYFIIASLALIVLAVLIIALLQRRTSKHKQKANSVLQQQKETLQVTLTELKATQSQLIQSEKMASLGELTAGIAHEIQNPLNFVNNFSEVSNELLDEMRVELSKGNYGDAQEIAEDVKQNLEKINHHGRRADAIVKGMLQHSKNSSGKKEPTDINNLADEYLKLAYHGLRAKDKTFNAELKTEYDQSIGNINIIPQDIGRVILNLVTNAFYVVDEKKKSGVVGYEPTVSVSTKMDNRIVSIYVDDNGNGIPKKVLDKIFQPFFTTKPTGQGTGLGLSLAYDIVKAHGGEITVKTREGQGSTFIISIPQ